jgi:hypothetical protein
MMASLATLGAAGRPWETRVDPGVPAAGWYSVKDFDPGNWKPYTPTYWPAQMADRRDNYWGAKIMMRFTREQLAAAIETARYTDPRTNEYLLETMIARQRKSGRYWFERTNPLDNFTLHGSAVCFDDLLLTYKLYDSGLQTTYVASVVNRDGRTIVQPENALTPVRATASGSACTPLLAIATDGDQYSIIRLRTYRSNGFDMSTYVHVARAENGALRIIGIWRD